MKGLRTILLSLISLSIGTSRSNAQWVQQASGTSAKLTDVVMIDTATAIVVGRDRSILKTTNSGTTWTNVAAPLSYVMPWNAISFGQDPDGIVVGDDGGVVVTTDRGHSWTWCVIPSRQRYLSALALGGGYFYVGADSGWVYRTLDTGKTWSSEKISQWPIRALFYWTGISGFEIPLYALTPYSLCSWTIYPYASWSETVLMRELGSEAFDAQFCFGGGPGFIVGVQGDFVCGPAIWRKSMSDTVWRAVGPANLLGGPFLGVSAPSANAIYVCGTNGMIYKSTDGGDTWVDQTTQTTRNLNAISFCDEKHGFAVGDSGLILYTSTGGLTSVEVRQSSPPTEFVLGQNYPNPFNPSTMIRYELPAGGTVTLRVYDFFGRQIRTLVDERQGPGTHSAIFDATGLASGVYFYRLQSGSHTATRKLVLVK